MERKERRNGGERREHPLTPPPFEPDEDDGLTATPPGMSHQEELQKHISQQALVHFHFISPKNLTWANVLQLMP